MTVESNNVIAIATLSGWLKVTEQVHGSNFSKIVMFGIHNLCDVGFLMQKKISEISFYSVVILSFLFCLTHYVTVQRCFSALFLGLIFLEFCHL